MPYYTFCLVAKTASNKISRSESLINMTVYVNHLNKPSNQDLIEPILYHFDNYTTEDILQKYNIIAIEKAADCEGCRENLLDQESHLSCDGGCLHVKDNCSICNF